MATNVVVVVVVVVGVVGTCYQILNVLKLCPFHDQLQLNFGYRLKSELVNSKKRKIDR